MSQDLFVSAKTRAGAAEAIQAICSWIASSQSLLAMTMLNFMDDPQRHVIANPASG